MFAGAYVDRRRGAPAAGDRPAPGRRPDEPLRAPQPAAERGAARRSAARGARRPLGARHHRWPRDRVARTAPHLRARVRVPSRPGQLGQQMAVAGTPRRSAARRRRPGCGAPRRPALRRRIPRGTCRRPGARRPQPGGCGRGRAGPPASHLRHRPGHHRVPPRAGRAARQRKPLPHLRGPRDGCLLPAWSGRGHPRRQPAGVRQPRLHARRAGRDAPRANRSRDRIGEHDRIPPRVRAGTGVRFAASPQGWIDVSRRSAAAPLPHGR